MCIKKGKKGTAYIGQVVETDPGLQLFRAPPKNGVRSEIAPSVGSGGGGDTAKASREAARARCAGRRREGAEVARGRRGEARVFGAFPGLVLFRGSRGGRGFEGGKGGAKARGGRVIHSAGRCGAAACAHRSGGGAGARSRSLEGFAKISRGSRVKEGGEKSRERVKEEKVKESERAERLTKACARSQRAAPAAG